MKKIKHFFSFILVFILTLTTWLSLLLLTLIGSTQTLFSRENIIELVKQTDLKELVGPKIEREIYQLLEQTGIPSDYVFYVFNNEQLKTYIGTYLADGVDSLLYQTEPPVISEEKLSVTLSSAFYQVLEEVGKGTLILSTRLTEQEQQLIQQKIEYFVPRIAAKIPKVETLIEDKVTNYKEEQTDKINTLYQGIKMIRFVFQQKGVLGIAIFGQLILIFVLKRKKFRYAKWFMVSFFLTGASLWYFMKQLPIFFSRYIPNQLEFIKDILDDIMNPIYASWNQTIIICLILSILLILLILLIFIMNKTQNHYKKGMARL